ncbi:SH3 domain-containing protein, partial [Desulfovibrio sp. OttesenSCG-928-C06]|nr:SH3 domain-containing protein [Desulfovibrio sp. OttesenSCG-928-C06]
MKYIFIPLFLLLLVTPAYAQDSGLPLLVTDNDHKGTNVRSAPGGAVIRVLPGVPKTEEELEMRAVTATGQEGPWLNVHLYDDSTGWMHASVLGTCASSTEDGEPVMYAEPDDLSPVVTSVKQDTPLRLLELRGIWAKVETTGSGAKKSGWMMEQTLFA